MKNLEQEQALVEGETQEELLDLAALAKDAGLGNKIMPRAGTVAYKRILQACQDYMFAVDASVAEGDAASDYNRRKYHDILCQIITGKPRESLSLSEREKISNFAALVMGWDDYVGSF